MNSYRAFIRDNARWLAGRFLLSFFSSFGQTFFISLSGAEIRAAYDISHGEFGGLYMLATLASAATLPVIGRLVDVLSVAKTVLIILPLLALATASMALSQSIAFLLISLYLLRLFGQGMMTHTAMTAMGRWYSGHRGRAISLVALGHQCGEASLPLIAVFLFSAWGWRQSWLVATAVLIVVGLPLLYALMRKERSPQQSLGPEKKAAVRQWRRNEVLKDTLFWRAICAVLAPSFIGTSIFFHQDYLVELRNWPAESFASAFVLLAIVTVVFALLAGQLIDKYSSVGLLPYYLLPLGFGCLAIALIDNQAGIYLFMALMGCSYGMSSVLFGALWPEMYGTAHLGAVRSVITAFMVLSSALGPGITGWMIDAGVPYAWQLLALGLYCVLASALMVPLRQKIKTRSEGYAQANSPLRSAPHQQPQ